MSPYQAYKFYLAIKLHFTVDSYDVFETRGAVRVCSASAFETNKMRGRFAFIAREHPEPKSIVQFFVACFAYSANVFDHQESKEAHAKWMKHKEMMTSMILDDLDTVDDITSALVGTPCKLMKMISGGHINIETAVAINRKMNFVEGWKHNFTHPSLYIRIKKLDRFISFNEEKVYTRISEMIEDKVIA